MKYFAGMDVSLEETAICVVDEAGHMVKEARATSEPDALMLSLPASIPLRTRWTGSLFADGLVAWRADFRWVARDLHRDPSREGGHAGRIKTDRNDARGIAHMMRTGWFKAVHVKTRQKLLAFCWCAPPVLNEMRTIENVVRAIFRETGLKLGTPARKDRMFAPANLSLERRVWRR